MGVFAPGHLGELTQYLPFELVDDILEQTRTVQRRLRDLPSRVGVYFVLALGMFPRLGYARVWDKLTAGLAGLPVPHPSEKALRDLRRRLGPAPLKALFEVVAGPLAQPRTPGCASAGRAPSPSTGELPEGARHRPQPVLDRQDPLPAGLRRVSHAAADGPGRDRHPRPARRHGGPGQARRDEAGLARQLLPLLRPGMLVLLDRAFDASAFLREVASTGAMLLARGTSTRRPPVLEHLPDGSYRSDLDGL